MSKRLVFGMDTPEISVITPARNAERTLAQCLDSLLAQTRPDWEALIVDDRSADGTAAIIAGYAARDGRFRGLTGPGRGVSAARNAGLAAARGRRVLFLDADDWIAPEFMAVMLAALEEHPCGIAYCGHARVMAEGALEPHPSDPAVAMDPVTSFARTCAVAIHAVLADRSDVVGIGGFDEGLRTCEDWDLWQRLAGTGRRWVQVDGVLSFYRTTQASLSRDLGQLLNDARTVIDRGFAGNPDDISGSFAGDGTADVVFAYLALWCATFARASGAPDVVPAAALAAVPRGPDTVRAFAAAVIDGVSVGLCAPRSTLAAKWDAFGPSVSGLIAWLGDVWQDPVAARRHQYAVEKLLLDYDELEQRRPLRLTMGIRIELERLVEVVPPLEVDRLCIHLAARGDVVAIRDVGTLGMLGARDIFDLVRDAPGAEALPGQQPGGSDGIRTRLIAWTHVVSAAARQPSRLRKAGRRRDLRKAAAQRARIGSLARAPARNGHGAALEALRRDVAERTVAAAPRDTGRVEDGAAYPVDAADRYAFRKDDSKDASAPPDPSNCGSAYEQQKDARTLSLLPEGPIRAALELACGQGRFTIRLAPRVEELIAADISSTALARAEARCRGTGSIVFRQLDLATDPLPGDRDLIVCSEALYSFGRGELAQIARRLAAALRPGGSLVTAHAFVLSEDMSRTGFDRAEPSGARTIVEILAATEGLVREATVETDLYRIDRFRRLEAAVAEAHTTFAPVDVAIEPDVLRQVVPGGAVARRADVANAESRRHMPVLMYHRIASDGPAALARYRVAPARFREQVTWLRRHGYHAIMSEHLGRFLQHGKPFPGRPVMLTFDDGYQDFEDEAWPVLRRHDFAPEVFVVSDLVGGPAVWDGGAAAGAPLMPAESIRRLASEGVSFGSHLATHRAADGLSTRELAEEMLRSRAQIAAWTGSEPKSLAAPYGVSDGRFRRLAHECGYEMVFSTVDAPAELGMNPLHIARIEVRGDWTLDDFAARMTALL